MEILISAGEASADRYGAAVMAAARRLDPSISFSGMGGPAMIAQGLETLADARDASVMGISAVLHRLPALWRAHRALRDRLNSGRVRGAFMIDFPDFHLRLAVTAHDAGIPVVHMVAPQVWAWRARRLRALPHQVDRLLCVLPFEEEMMRQAGVDARFIGHPMRDLTLPSCAPEEARRRHALPPDSRLVGLMPGSRAQVIRRLLPRMVKTALRILERQPNVQFLLPVAPTIDPTVLEGGVRALGARAHVRQGPFADLASCCDAAIASSGTATLELALLGVPCVIVYRVGVPLSWLIRRWVKVPHVGLPNLIAGRRLLPEHLQEEFRPGRVADEVLRWLSNPEELQRLSAELLALRSRLGEPGVLERAAKHLLESVR